MTPRVQARVVNVTPRSRLQSAAMALGLVIEVTGWFLVAGAALQGLGTMLTLGLALIAVFLGRRLRAM